MGSTRTPPLAPPKGSVKISDVSTGVYNPNGLEVNSLRDHLAKNPTLKGYSRGEEISNSQLLEIECDILVPAALQNQITEKNADRLRCKMLAEGANRPTTLEADKIRQERGVFVLPDVLGNAGGVTVSYVEWVQDTQNFNWSLEEINGRLHKIMVEAFHRALARSQRDGLDMRTAAPSKASTESRRRSRSAGCFLDPRSVCVRRTAITQLPDAILRLTTRGTRLTNSRPAGRTTSDAFRDVYLSTVFSRASD